MSFVARMLHSQVMQWFLGHTEGPWVVGGKAVTEANTAHCSSDLGLEFPAGSVYRTIRQYYYLEGSVKGAAIKSCKCGIYIYIHLELHIRTVIGIAMTTCHPACQRLRADPRLGFHRERAGGLCYWKRSRQNVAGNLDVAAPRWTQHSDVWGKGSGSLWRWLRWRAVFFEDGCAEWVRNIFLVSHFFCLAHTFWSLQKKNQGLSLEIHDNRLLNHHAASLHVTGRCRWSLSMA